MSPSSASPTPSVGLIGIGLLGSELAHRLLTGGVPLLGFDLNAGSLAAFGRQGGILAANAAEIFARCDRVLLSLPSHEEVTALLTDYAGALRPGQTIIDTTTGDPENAETLAEELGARGVVYLDATISGSSTHVREGSAVLMVGGEAGAYASCADLFALLACASFHTGAAGTGAKMKLITNLVLGLNRAALAEGLALAEALAFDPRLTLAIMRSSPAYSRAMDTKGEKMIRGDFTPEARLSQHLKDVRLIIEAGEASGLPMALSRTHREILEAAEAAGLGALDNSSIIQILSARYASGTTP